MQNNESGTCESAFRLVSFGIAAENKAIDSDLLEITPLETQSYLDGEILPNPQELSDSAVGADGGSYTVEVTTANSIQAKWLQWGSNRKTPPDIRRGERVLLYQYESTDQYYWVSTGLDDHLRRLETVTYLFSDTTVESTDKLTPENSYAVEISTHSGQITLTTCKANGEPYAYLFQFNTKDGAVTLTDDDGNYAQLDSEERRFIFINKDMSRIIIDKRSIYLESGDLIDLKTRTVNITAQTMNVNLNTLNANINTTYWRGLFNLQGPLTTYGTVTHNYMGSMGSTGSTGSTCSMGP